MSGLGRKNSSSRISWANLLPSNTDRRSVPYEKKSSSAPSSTTVSRRGNNFRASISVVNDVNPDSGITNPALRDCVAWQMISQQLSLQLEQRRNSEIAARRIRAFSLVDRYKGRAPSITDQPGDLQFLPAPDDDKISQIGSHTGDAVLALEEDEIKNASLLKTDVHTIPIEQLVQRYNSDLTTGLTNDLVVQHRTTFGENKLTPSRPPSLLWMFIKELLIGFNGILWVATLFAFLSYVSSRYSLKRH